MTLWQCPPEWAGETAFVVAGGPSVADCDLSLLAGRRVIAIKSSWTAVPAADFMVWHDQRWWDTYGKHAVATFAGRIVTSHKRPPTGCLPMRAVPSAHGIAEAPTDLAISRTTTQAAMNLAVHLGVTRIVILGLDLTVRCGRNHHHDEPPWAWQGHKWFAAQVSDLRHTVEPLKRRGVEVANCSPVSSIDWWPKRALADVVAELDG